MLRSLFAFVLCLVAPLASAAELDVVATVPDLAALAKAVGGDRVSVTSMSLPTQDPHFVDARPSLALKLAKADVLLAVGLQLEIGWLPTLQTGSRNGKIQPGGAGYLEAAASVPLLGVPAGAIDRSMGDVHPGGNPHFLYDPRAAARVAKAIGAKFAELDPEGAATYAANADALAADLAAREPAWLEKVAPIRGRSVVVFHETLLYLQDWIGFEVAIAIEPKPGISPDPLHVQRVVETGRARSVAAVLQE
jgi:zinc/manganese transport system substrate-binding protein